MKLNEMRYMRTLTSYKGAKLKREARIKSKKFVHSQNNDEQSGRTPIYRS